MSGEKDNHNQAQQPEPESNNAANKETAAALKSADYVMMVSDENDWDRLVHTAGLVLVDVYNDWCGPCASMETHLKKLRVQSLQNDDRVTLARACCDNIEELAPFRQDPRPTWLFLSSGIPTALMRGANRPLLTKLFLNELELEREGRMPIYIDYKSQSVIQCMGPLGALAQDKTIQSIGAGRTEMLSDLFQDRALTPLPSQDNSVDNSKQSAASDKASADKSSGSDVTKEEATEREIVDILLAADLENMAEDGEEYEDGLEDKLYTSDGSNPNLITKPKKKLELKAGLLREILSNKPKRHTFSGLYL